MPKRKYTEKGRKEITDHNVLKGALVVEAKGKIIHILANLTPRPPPFYYSFAFTILHRSRRVAKKNRTVLLSCITRNANRR